MKHNYNRRKFLKSTAVAGIGVVLGFKVTIASGKDVAPFRKGNE